MVTPWSLVTIVLPLWYVCVCIYIYIYIYVHMHAHTHKIGVFGVDDLLAWQTLHNIKKLKTNPAM